MVSLAYEVEAQIKDLVSDYVGRASNTGLTVRAGLQLAMRNTRQTQYFGFGMFRLVPNNPQPTRANDGASGPSCKLT